MTKEQLGLPELGEGGLIFTEEEMRALIDIPAIAELQGDPRFTVSYAHDHIRSQVTITDEAGKAWVVCGLRDRRFDGTEQGYSPLYDWNPNTPTDIPPSPSTVEQSHYFNNPNDPLSAEYGALADMIEHPFEWMGRIETPEQARVYAHHLRAFIEDPNMVFPGKASRSTVTRDGGFSTVISRVHDLLRSKGVEYVASNPTWFNIAEINANKLGFQFSHEEDAQVIQKLADRTSHLTRVQRSWVVFTQYYNQLLEDQGMVPEQIIGSDVVMRDENGSIITYPFSIDHTLWQHKKL